MTNNRLISNRYEILSLVGSGGMADVYKAKDVRLNRYVAIKILREEYNQDKEFLERFDNEAKSIASLSHSNIVNIFDFGIDDGLRYIVMELVDGITLKDYIKEKGKLTIKETIGIAILIAQGLEVAHAAGIIHRDIKPQNIIISEDGRVKITDFGIAKSANTNTIVAGNNYGSVHYMSPEVVRGGFIDVRSDIYSLGVTIFEMLTGKLPFNGENDVSVAMNHIEKDMAPLHTIDRNVPKAISMVIFKCMQKKPESRYKNVSELLIDLRQAIKDPYGDFVVINKIEDDSLTKKVDINGNISNYSKKSKDDKYNKIILGGTIVASILVCCILVLILKSTLPIFNSSKEKTDIDKILSGDKVIIPDLIGKNLEEVEQIAEKEGFEIRYDLKFSDTIDKNCVISQSIEAGEEMPLTETLYLVVSTGDEFDKMPDVRGKTIDSAKQFLSESGYDVRVRYENSEIVDKGDIIRTIPAEGETVKDNDIVTIVVSLGKEPERVNVPKITGFKIEEAKAKLSSVNLKLGSISEEFSDNVEKGIIIKQSLSPSSVVEEWSTVNIVISKGKEIKEDTDEKENDDTDDKKEEKPIVDEKLTDDKKEEKPVVDNNSNSSNDNVSEPSDSEVEEIPEDEFFEADDEEVIEEKPSRYIGSVTIPSISEDSANITLVLIQNGSQEVIYEGTKKKEEFPFTFSGIVSESGNGNVRVIVNGQAKGSYPVNFQKE